MDAATLTIDLDRRRCCYCTPGKTRCMDQSCPCYRDGRRCDSACESSNWTGDCLNKPIIRCQCSQTYNATGIRGKPEFIFCNQNETCPCYRYHENCAVTCGCRGECSNTPGQDHNALDYSHFPKLDRPLCGCSCSSRSACKKFKKCLCLQSLSYCGLGCKCQRECANTKSHFELSKKARNSFFDPEDSSSGLVAILHIIGPNYSFQLEFTTPNVNAIHAEEILGLVLTRALSVYNIPLQHVIVYTPNSPCFHQDCHPSCDMVDQCFNGKSCSTALAILYSQLRKLTRNTHVEMTVRFLNPYITRGDLYTKRAILALMEAGIRVEPITIKEWSDLMRDSVYKMQKRSVSLDRLLHRIKEPSEVSLSPTASAYHTLWNVANMDRFVRRTQHYVNECRRTLGYDECYWTSAFHDLLKMTVLACAGASEKLKHISIHFRPPLSSSSRADQMDTASQNKRIQQLKRQSRLSTADDDGQDSEASSSASSFKKKHRMRCYSGPSSYKNSRFEVVDEVVESISKSTKELNLAADYAMTAFAEGPSADVNHSPRLGGSTEQQNSRWIRQGSESNKSMANNMFSSSVASSNVSIQAPAAALADKILMNLAGRNITQAEQEGIKEEVVGAIEILQEQLGTIMQYLDQKVASVPI